MPPVRLGLLVAVLAILVVVQVACWIAARSLLRLRVPLVACAVAILLPLALLAPRFVGGEIFLPTGPFAQLPGNPVLTRGAHDTLNDVSLQLLPWEREVRRAFAAGRPPLWSDRLGGGSSPWSNPQTQTLSPLAWAARPLPLEHFFLGLFAVKSSVAATGAWVLATAIGLRRRARWAAAASFALGGGMVVWGLFPLSAALAWTPWLAASAVVLVRRPARRSFLAAALATLGTALAGHPEVALFGGLFAASLALGAAPRRRRARRLAGAALAAMLGLALAAPVLLPFAAIARRSIRHAELADRAATPAEPAAARPDRALALLHPEPFGRPFTERYGAAWIHPSELSGGYAGLFALAGLANLGALARHRSLRAAAVFLAVALAVGLWPPAQRALAGLPVFGSVVPERLLPLVGLALALLGAAGWEARWRARRRSRADAVAFAALATASLAVAPSMPLAVGWAALAASGFARGRLRRHAPALAALVLVLDLGHFARAFLPAGEPRQLAPATEFLDELVARAAGGPARVAGAARESYPYTLSLYGLEDFRPHDPLASAAYVATLGPTFGFRPSMREYFAAVERIDHPFASFLGIRFVIQRPPRPAIPGWTRLPVTDPRGVELWENPAALDRFFVADGFEAVPAAAIPERLAGLDAPRRALVALADLPRLAEAGPAPEGTVETLERRDGRARLRLELPRAALIASSVPSPGEWRVRIDGRQAPSIAVHGAFLGFVAPAGLHEAELAYRPPYWRSSWGIAAAAALLLAVASRRRALFAKR